MLELFVLHAFVENGRECSCPIHVIASEGWFAQWLTSGKLGTFMERDELTIPSNDCALMDELDTVTEAFLQSACALGQVSATLGTISDHQSTSSDQSCSHSLARVV